ncbi:MAG: hypothetical protein LQ339_001087 [Xanthoria mediterranea]|nr:MAG: hypothetical protein LQ339_001087 [Xanthoria mediterranea]
MSFYEAQSWQLPMRQGSWDQPPPPSRSSTNSIVPRDENSAFDIQIEEVDRALENLNKSGKQFMGPSRRDSMPMMGGPRQYSEFGSGMSSISQHRHSIGDYDQMRSHSGSNLQNFYANQRHQSRPNEAEQMMQAKRRMAAQRERELRNYHQEQQYNRMSSQNKSDRATSPNTMNEEDRRELIARQHRALYGGSDSGSLHESRTNDESQTPRPGIQSGGASGSASGGRGASPRTFDPYAMGQNQAQANIAEAAMAVVDPGQQNSSTGPSPKPQQQRSRANSNSSPASNNPQNFSLFESGAQQSSRTSTSSPGDSSPHPSKGSAPTSGGVAPIGTRPAQNPAVNPALSKRSTTPLPSPLSYGFAPTENLSATNNKESERSTSAASNPSSGTKEGSGLAWGNSSGVWGQPNKNPLGVQASVWG